MSGPKTQEMEQEMKKIICLFIIVCMAMTQLACTGKKDSRQPESFQLKKGEIPGAEEIAQECADNQGTGRETEGIEGIEGVSTLPSMVSFKDRAAEIEEMIAEAKAQYEEEDYSRLPEPVQYNILWLGCTTVFYDGITYRMSDFDREYLEAVVLNFEKSVERIVNHNLDINIDFFYVDGTKELTKDEEEDLYLDRRTVQEEIDRYMSLKDYDTVLTTIRCDDSILGVNTHGLEDVQGYSTFNIAEPREGEYPLADPEIPSLYATSVAIHEWMHQLEYMGMILDVEYPNTHAYKGPDEFPGYQEYIADQNNYDFMEFYELVLQGKLPYTEDGAVRHVGMYPEMWKLAKRDALNIGTFTITNQRGEYLSAQDADPKVTLSETECRWIIKYGLNGCYCFIPERNQNVRLDLSDAWDDENNPVGLFEYNPLYPDAQRWEITENTDGSSMIHTAYGSRRVLTVDGIGEEAVIRKIEDDFSQHQEWIITQTSHKVFFRKPL